MPGTDALSSRKNLKPQQSRTNPASQQQNKKSNNKQTQVATQNQSQTQKATSSAVPASSNPPKPKSSPPPPAQLKQQQQQQQQAKEHVPLDGFNSSAIDELLSKGLDPQAEVYKPEQQQQLQRSGAWTQKASTMSNGKDFWLELRRQIGVLQRGESTNKGG